MRTYKFLWIAVFAGLFFFNRASAQPRVKVVSGQLILDDGTAAPNEKKYVAFIDSLNEGLKTKPNDTTSLFYRSLLYLKFNSMQAKPDLNSSVPANNLLYALLMADRADSLKMQHFKLKVLKAQICKELTSRYANVDAWRYNAQQIVDRKRKYEYYKVLANKYYDQLAVLDSNNAYDYQKLKVK